MDHLINGSSSLNGTSTFNDGFVNNSGITWDETVEVADETVIFDSAVAVAAQ